MCTRDEAKLRIHLGAWPRPHFQSRRLAPLFGRILVVRGLMSMGYKVPQWQRAVQETAPPPRQAVLRRGPAHAGCPETCEGSNQLNMV